MQIFDNLAIIYCHFFRVIITTYRQYKRMLILMVVIDLWEVVEEDYVIDPLLENSTAAQIKSIIIRRKGSKNQR